MGRQIKYSLFLFFGIFLVFCHKPRNGDYYLIYDGTKTTTSCPTPTNCNTGTEAVSTKSLVSVENSQKNSLEVDGKIWGKDHNNVSYEHSFTETYSTGATESFTFAYSGTIKNKFLVEGTYTINSVYTENPAVVQTSNTGNFTLKVKK